MKQYRFFAVILLLLGLLALPFALFGVFGLAGSDAENFALMYIGYFFYLLCAVLGIWRKKFLFGCLVGILIFALGSYLDRRFWTEHNQNLCVGLRADPYCTESTTGFQCIEPSHYGNMVTSSSFCRKKLSTEEHKRSNKKKRAYQLEQAKKSGKLPVKKIPDLNQTNKALDVFQAIAKIIVSSPKPETLDFEDDLVSVYHCLQEEFENPIKGEMRASNMLKLLIKTEEEKERYARYHAAHGRHLNPSHLVAALPNGPKNFGCESLPENEIIKQ